MTQQQEWEDVEVPRGAYVAWGAKPGQEVVGTVLTYSEDGGTDFNGKPCPTMALELIEPAYSVNKEGVRTNHDVGDVVHLNAGQVSLKRGLRLANPSPGDTVKITLHNLARTERGTVKEFSIKIARGKNHDILTSDKPPF